MKAELRPETIEVLGNLPRDIQPVLSQNIIFEFPKSFSLQPFCVDSYHLSTVQNTLFGKKYGDLTIYFRELLNCSIINRLFDEDSLLKQKNFSIIAAIVDPTATPLRGIKYDVEKIREVNCHGSNLGLFICQVNFKVKKITFVELYE